MTNPPSDTTTSSSASTTLNSSTRYQGISELLDALCNEGDPEEVLTMDHLLANLRRRGFGMFLFISILPGFIPIPGAAGIIAGPLSILIGIQLILGLKRPWVPRFIGKRGPKRATLIRFRERIARWLQRLERLARPRMGRLFRSKLASIYTGLLIIALGILFALPIPLTNYVFALLLLLFAFTLLERDGALMIVAWILSTITVVAFTLLSTELSQLIANMVHKLSA